MANFDIKNLTLDEKIGQLIIFGFDGYDINEHAINLIKRYKAGNVILFTRNISTPEQVFKLNQNLQKLALETVNIPMFITIDQEGGMVTRIKKGVTFFPGSMTISASNNLENSYLVGKKIGQELISLGININLAPTLDINNNPYNPVIGVRSYGDTKEIVTKNGLAFIKGLQENVIATAKHFPGHGDTFIDSHLELPKINKTLKELEKFELAPFKAAIDDGVKAIMTAHINFPALTEDGLPITLSYNSTTNLLRKKLGFEGLIITDCMQMKAIQKDYTTEKGSIMALKAGANLFHVSHSEELQIGAINSIKKAILNNELDIKIIDERVARILKFKSDNLKVDIFSNYQDIKYIIESQESKNFVLDVTRQAVTLVKGNNVIINKNTLLIASEPLSTTIADDETGSDSIIKYLNKEIPELDTLSISVNLNDDLEIEKIVNISKKYKQVIICSYNANIYINQLKLIRKLNSETKLYVIAMRNPYDIIFEKEIKNFVCLYEYTPNSIKILAEYLQGKIKPQGKLPVRL